MSTSPLLYRGFHDVTAYFAETVSYLHKVFTKLAPVEPFSWWPTACIARRGVSAWCHSGAKILKPFCHCRHIHLVADKLVCLCLKSLFSLVEYFEGE